MKNKKTKKGFTLVELLVVITILAVLATVSVIGYRSFTKKAQISNDMSLVTQLNLALQADEVDGGKANTPSEALEVVEEAGYIVPKLTPTTAKYNIIWNQSTNRFALLDEKGNKVDGAGDTSSKAYENWTFVSKYEGKLIENGYSVYLNSDFTGELPTTVSVGIDTGKNRNISIRYENKGTAQNNVVMNMNGGTLEVNAPLDTVSRYGKAESVTVTAVASNSYHEFGEVDGNITLKAGHVSLESQSSVNSIIIDTTDINSVAVTQNDQATINGTVVALDESVNNELSNSSSIQVKDEVLNSSTNVALINSGNAGELKTLLEAGKYCLLTSDITFDWACALQNKEFTLDLNNFTLTFFTITLTNNSTGSIKNGTLISTNTKKSTDGCIYIYPGNKLEMTNINLLVEKASGVFPFAKSELVLKNTKIKAAVYALGTNASNAQVNSPLINIVAYNSEFVTYTEDYDNTALYINRPIVAYFEGCTFNGGRQAVFVRGGNATFKDCKLIVSGSFSSMNKYLNDTWGSGNELPTAALTIGNRSTNAYNYSTSVTLLNTELEVLNNKDAMYALYAYGLTQDNYTVSISYDSSCVLGRTNLNDEIGNVVVSKI